MGGIIFKPPLSNRFQQNLVIKMEGIKEVKKGNE
jgi:hypothetical protein